MLYFICIIKEIVYVIFKFLGSFFRNLVWDIKLENGILNYSVSKFIWRLGFRNRIGYRWCLIIYCY